MDMINQEENNPAFKPMNFVWVQLGPDTHALIPDNAAGIRKLTPVPDTATVIFTAKELLPDTSIRYRAQGFFFNPPRRFTSLKEAKVTIETIARDSGHTVDGW